MSHAQSLRSFEAAEPQRGPGFYYDLMGERATHPVTPDASRRERQDLLPEVGVVFTKHCLRGSVAFCHIVSLDTGILPLYTEAL